MRTIITLVASVIATAALAAPTTVAQTGDVTPAASPPLRNGCAVLYRQSYHASYARSVYRRPAISTEARRKLRRLRVCARSGEAGRNMRRLERTLSAERAYRLAVARVAPYRCSFGMSAIPCYIVLCESGGSWSAYNPSGAAGRYQIMPFHGRPFPVRTAADRLAHHRIAARLWRGGAGASNWVCA